MSVVDAGKELERGRDAYARRAWADAYLSLTHADRAAALGVEDLELLAMSALMVGRVDEYLSVLERVHHAYVDAGQGLRAARAGFWLGMTLATRGESGPAGGWFARAQRLVEREPNESVERGYLLVPVAFQHLMAGEYDAAYATTAAAADIGERLGDTGLVAAALHFQGEVRIKQNRVEEGLRLLDEAMVALTAADVPPILTGVVYCGVIACCEEAFDPRRAREWTNALSRWCEAQPQMVAFTGRCLAHRAAIMQLHGEWQHALAEAGLARERGEQVMNRAAVGQALYQQGELQRLRGDLAAAEAAYREASRYGHEPQPGLALLRLGQGQVDAAAAAIRRVLGETTQPLRRAALQPAYAEIMLAAGKTDEARQASDELGETAAKSRSAMLGAIAAHVSGAVSLAEAEVQAALSSLRQAWQLWEELDAPYEIARVRVLVALACRALGDDDSAALELEAARAVFDELGAAPDLTRVDALTGSTAPRRTHGLTPRELEVLRLVAAGKTNREIAAALVVSEHTVARHVQNIFAKLRVPSRAAATAFAFEHDLV